MPPGSSAHNGSSRTHSDVDHALTRTTARLLGSGLLYRHELDGGVGSATWHEVTVQPVTRLGVDAAIVFSDILIPVEAMGMELELEDQGPHFPSPPRTAADIERLAIRDPEAETGFVAEAIRPTRSALSDSVPVIGFAGAPFTLAAYMVEGGGSKSFIVIKRLLFEQPKLAHALFEKLTETLIPLLEDAVGRRRRAPLRTKCAGGIHMKWIAFHTQKLRESRPFAEEFTVFLDSRTCTPICSGVEVTNRARLHMGQLAMDNEVGAREGDSWPSGARRRSSTATAWSARSAAVGWGVFFWAMTPSLTEPSQ